MTLLWLKLGASSWYMLLTQSQRSVCGDFFILLGAAIGGFFLGPLACTVAPFVIFIVQASDLISEAATGNYHPLALPFLAVGATVLLAVELAGLIIISQAVLPYSPFIGAIAAESAAYDYVSNHRRSLTKQPKLLSGLPEITLTNYKFADDITVHRVQACECH
jgi:hypothetical protein